MSEHNVKWKQQLADSRDAFEAKVDVILRSLLNEMSGGTSTTEKPPERSEAATQTEPEVSNMQLVVSLSPVVTTSDSGTLVDQKDEASRDILHRLRESMPEGEEALRATIAVTYSILIQQKSTIRSFEQSLVSLRDENSVLVKRLEAKEAENRKYQAAQETHEITTNRLTAELKKAGREVETLRKSIGEFHIPASPLFQSVKDAVLRDMRGEKSVSPRILSHPLQLTEDLPEARPVKRPRTNSRDPSTSLVIDTEIAHRPHQPATVHSAPIIPGRPLDTQMQNMFPNHPSAPPRPTYTNQSHPANAPPQMPAQMVHPHLNLRGRGHRPSRSLSLDVHPNPHFQPPLPTQGPQSSMLLYTVQQSIPPNGNGQPQITAIPYGWKPPSASPAGPVIPIRFSHPPPPLPVTIEDRSSTLLSMPPPSQQMHAPQPQPRSANQSPATQPPLSLVGRSPSSHSRNLEGSIEGAVPMNRSQANSSSNPTSGVGSTGSAVNPVSGPSFPRLPTRPGPPKVVPIEMSNPKARRLCEALWDLTEVDNVLAGRCKTCGLTGQIIGSFGDALQHSANSHLAQFDDAYVTCIEGQSNSKTS
ncbi:hypothetical protein PIIN_07005 [Serendipita indica DSM 11827]|uniref:Uncharacterized protein n=1 Tax=Serendipita indica (strain DSM 11827) TaxID=1109443 RepID=G4TP07_SERID|nr:hypothetical protein PIIN_07005 [Serendipita indica DSM 11827]